MNDAATRIPSSVRDLAPVRHEGFVEIRGVLPEMEYDIFGLSAYN